MSLPENSFNTEEVKHDLGLRRPQDNKVTTKVFTRRSCRFYLRNGTCMFGNGCRYLHSTPELEPADVNLNGEEVQGQKDSPDLRRKPEEICHFFARFGHCRYGRSCWYIHKKTVPSGRDNGKDSSQVAVEDGSGARVQTGGTFEGEAKAERSVKPDADVASAGPPPVTEVPAEESLEALRDREIQQFLKRYRNCQKVESNDGTRRFNFLFRPTDPDWRFDVRELTLTVAFPPTYPKDYFSVNVYDDEAVLPSLLVRDLNKAIAKWLRGKHVANQAENPNQLVMRPFLRWFDRSLEDLFIESLRKVKRIQLAQEAGIEFVPHEQLSSNNTSSPSSSGTESSTNENAAMLDLENATNCANDDNLSQNCADGDLNDQQSLCLEVPRVVETNSLSAGDKPCLTNVEREDSSVTIESGLANFPQSCSSKEDAACVNGILPSGTSKTSDQGSVEESIAQVEKGTKFTAANGASQAIVTNPKRGTEIKLRRLEMGENVGTLECRHISIRIQCARCKCSAEVTTPPRRRNVVTCGRCNKNISAVFRSNMMHPYNSVIGYLDLTDCFVLDLVLPQCVFEAVCLGCDKEMKIDGIHIGQQKVTWCQSCNCKLTFLLESVKFQNLQPAKSTDANGTFLIKAPKAAKKVRDPAIQEGKPLPDDGACKHYKKSYRWLRFPCCGKAYACDVCHEEHEGDHEMKYATRMICGHCAKEQPYSTDKPCIGCSGYMTKKVTAHWEGGRGCRDRIKMSRDDNKKYSGAGKTISRKAQATKPTGKK